MRIGPRVRTGGEDRVGGGGGDDEATTGTAGEDRGLPVRIGVTTEAGGDEAGEDRGLPVHDDQRWW